MAEEKKVQFDLYCKTCKYYQDDESEDRCNECLAHKANTKSNKPVKWRKR